MQEILTRARATEVRATFSVVAGAAKSPFSREHPLAPGHGRRGRAPGYSSVSASRRDSRSTVNRYQLDWENWVLPEGMPGDPTVRGLIGISITTSDRALGLAIMDLIPANAKFALGETYTFIFATQTAPPRLSRADP